MYVVLNQMNIKCFSYLFRDLFHPLVVVITILLNIYIIRLVFMMVLFTKEVTRKLGGVDGRYGTVQYVIFNFIVCILDLSMSRNTL